MLPEGLKLREVIEANRFAQELRRIVANVKQADDFVDGAKWVLSRDPLSGKRIGKSKVWFLALQEIPNILPVVLYYTFDEDSVILLSIEETIYPPKD